jgi:Flp pilus assembly protein TadD
MSDYYQVLGVPEKAQPEEIKSAYRRLLRKYPPEQCPEDFQRIRRAYETLANAKARAAYDASIKHKDEIDFHTRAGTEALDNEQYGAAIKSFKRILVIEPSLTFARNLLGTALYWNGEYEKAMDQFLRCTKEDPENSTYHLNLGCAYRLCKALDKAEACFRTAWELDPMDHTVIIAWASLLFYSKNDYAGAVRLLRQAIGYDGQVDFEDFLYFVELVEIAIVAQKDSDLAALTREIKAILPDDDKAREYVAYRFAAQAAEWTNQELYAFAHKLARVAATFAPTDEAIQKLLGATRTADDTYKAASKLFKDQRVPPQIWGVVYYYLYWDTVVEKEGASRAEVLRKKNYEAALAVAEHDPDTALSAISVLRHEYGILITDLIEDYDQIYNLARSYKSVRSKFSWLSLFGIR